MLPIRESGCSAVKGHNSIEEEKASVPRNPCTQLLPTQCLMRSVPVQTYWSIVEAVCIEYEQPLAVNGSYYLKSIVTTHPPKSRVSWRKENRRSGMGRRNATFSHHHRQSQTERWSQVKGTLTPSDNQTFLGLEIGTLTSMREKFRIANDGRAYTYEEFLEFYGDGWCNDRAEVRWLHAMPVIGSCGLLLSPVREALLRRLRIRVWLITRRRIVPQIRKRLSECGLRESIRENIIDFWGIHTCTPDASTALWLEMDEDCGQHGLVWEDIALARSIAEQSNYNLSIEQLSESVECRDNGSAA